MSKRITLARLTVIGILSVLVILYVWQPGGERVLELVSDLLYLGAATAAAGLAFLAGSRFDRGTLQRRAWSLLALGLGFWTVAECLWTYYQIGVGEDVPYPSLADGIWAAGYIPLILGLYLGYRALGVVLPARLRLVVLIAYAAVLAAFSWGLLRPMFYGPSPASPNEALMGSFYLISNLTLAFIGTLSLIVVWDGLIGLPWLSITLGLLLFAVSDSAFAYAAWRGTYAVGANWQSGVIDVAYLTAYLAVALAAFRQSSLRLADAVQPHGAG